MLREECRREINKVADVFVVSVRPVACELETITRFHFAFSAGNFFQVPVAGCVGVLFGFRSVRNNKYLDVLEKPSSCPETVSLITVNLIERFLDGNSTPFEFYVN